MTDTSNLSPSEVAETIGTVVKVAMIQSAGALEALRNANQALHDNDVERATAFIRNYLEIWDGPNGVLVDLNEAIYSAIPRTPEGVSYG